MKKKFMIYVYENDVYIWKNDVILHRFYVDFPDVKSIEIYRFYIVLFSG